MPGLKLFHISKRSPWSIFLTHWGRLVHIWISKLSIIGSYNGLLPGQHQAIIWTNPGILLIWTPETNLKQKSYIFIQENAFENVISEIATMSSRPQCVIQIKYGLPYCVTCPSMSTDPGSLNPGTRRSRVPRWWDPGIRTNTGAGDTVLAKHT